MCESDPLIRCARATTGLQLQTDSRRHCTVLYCALSVVVNAGWVGLGRGAIGLGTGTPDVKRRVLNS
eukprot:4947860-Pyramimonas_sp.AAC.1